MTVPRLVLITRGRMPVFFIETVTKGVWNNFFLNLLNTIEQNHDPYSNPLQDKSIVQVTLKLLDKSGPPLSLAISQSWHIRCDLRR